MSKRKSPRDDNRPGEKKNGSSTGSDLCRRPADLWGNLIYFSLVTAAICFILVNNALDQLMTTTGIVVLSLLFILDLFAIIPLAKLSLSAILSRKNN